MATYSRDDLRNAALQDLGVIDGQGPPSPEDAKLADDRCQQQLEYLYDQGYISFDLDGAIPARFFVPLTRIVAQALMLPFGVMSRATIVTANATAAMRALAALKEHRYVGTPQRAEYF